MFRFLRHIRQDLAEGHTLPKYLPYAVGEVLLVMLGILLALQVNNWNENRQQRKQELEILNDLRLNLIDSRAQIASAYDDNLISIDDYRKLASIIEQDLPYSNDLDSIFGNLPYWTTPYLTYTAYETLRNQGIDIVENDDLKNKIVFIYENRFAFITGDWDRWEWNINQDITMPYFNEHIEGSLFDRYLAQPNDFEQLKADQHFRNLLGVLYRTRSWGIELSESTLHDLDELISDLNAELTERGFMMTKSSPY